MKRTVILALSAVLMILLCACGGKEQTADFSVEAALEQLLSQVAVDDPLELGEEDMLDFFGIQAEDMQEFAAVTCANGISAQEIVLVKAKDEDSAKRVEEKLQSRLSDRMAQAEGYLPEEHAILSECAVTRQRLYVSLIIHPEHEALTKLYQENFN